MIIINREEPSASLQASEDGRHSPARDQTRLIETHDASRYSRLPNLTVIVGVGNAKIYISYIIIHKSSSSNFSS